MNCIAAQLDTGRIEGLSNIFSSLDTDCDGTLSTAELAAGLAELGVDPDAISQLVDVVDMNNDGHIQYSEFVASLLHTQGKLVEDILLTAFHVIDVNGDGQISLDELSAMLSSGGPLVSVLPDGKTVEQVLNEVDTSRDGVISFREFKAYLMGEAQGGSRDELIDPDRSAVQENEQLDVTLPRLAGVLGRSDAELRAQATRLADLHWMCTVGDLQQLSAEDWPRLGLPLKLERVLRAYVSG